MNTFDEMAARYETPQRVQVANTIADAMRPRLAGCFGSLLLADACLFPLDVARPKER